MSNRFKHRAAEQETAEQETAEHISYFKHQLTIIPNACSVTYICVQTLLNKGNVLHFDLTYNDQRTSINFSIKIGKMSQNIDINKTILHTAHCQ